MTLRLRLCAALVFAAATLLLQPSSASAMPAFARKYKLGCNMCHTLYPQLNRFGRDFRDNGFRMPDEIEKVLKKRSGRPATAGQPADEKSPDEEDFWSFIPENIPFAIQAKVHDAMSPKGDVKSDFQIEELQLQAGGTWTPRVSYYLHHHLAEEGEPGKLYTGWVRFNNLAGSNWFNLAVGQVELPLSFSPEIERLSVFEYLAFDRTLGANPFNLATPQLGVQYFGQSEGGTKVWLGVVNGVGLAVDEATESFDNNSFKDVYGRVTQEMGEHYVGGFAYFGRGRGQFADGDAFNDNFVRLGGDAFVNLTPIVVYGSALYARDDDPLGTGERRSLFGGFVEGDLFVSDRTVVLVRLDAVRQKLPAFFTGAEEGEEPEAGGAEGEPEEEAPFRVNTFAVTPGLQYLVRPNVKLGFEYQVRQARREDRAIALLHVSF